jgi:hypothetical protein
MLVFATLILFRAGFPIYGGSDRLNADIYAVSLKTLSD